MYTQRFMTLITLLAFTACGGDDSKPTNEIVNSEVTDSDMPESETTDDEDVSELFFANCPEGFQTEVLSDGQHGGFNSSGQERSFLLKLPATPEDGGTYPLIVVFHDTDNTGQGFYDDTSLQAFVDHGFMILALDGNKNGIVWPDWDALRNPSQQDLENHDMNFFDEALACIQDMYSIDQQRIFVLGKSAGGIMTNYVLQRRSDILAGGITSSGVIEYTTPVPPVPLENMTIVVAYGGDNDQWSGGSDNPEEGETSTTVNFSEQSAISSAFYEDNENINQIYCKGGELGHEWLTSINSWLADFLMTHPKDNHVNPDYVFESPENDDGTVCDEGIATYDPGIVVECPESTNQCDTYCQLLGDCAVENATLVAILIEQIVELGFTGENNAECGGCIEACTADLAASTNVAADEAVLTCFAGHQETAECSAGIAGATPAIIAINQCCENQAESQICTRLCGSMITNEPVTNAGVFTSCDLWAPEGEPAEDAGTPSDADSSDAGASSD